MVEKRDFEEASSRGDTATLYSGAAGDVRWCFAGKVKDAAIREILPADVQQVGLRQVHAAVVVEAHPGGRAREGDALISDRRGLALAIVTADCVPVLLASGNQIAAVHAGWRGIVAGVVREALNRLRRVDAHSRAWIGPSIGRCCYEVGSEVAEAVASASGTEPMTSPEDGGRPHLDLAAAVRRQLEEGGVTSIETLPGCTRCRSRGWWSYRREGPGAGRNVALIWRG